LILDPRTGLPSYPLPAPPPHVRPALPSPEVLAMEPAAAALEIYRQFAREHHPGAIAEIRRMQAVVAASVADLVENARVGTSSGDADPASFCHDAARLLRERNRLDGCLARLGEEHPQRQPIDVEVLDLVKGIRRFSDLRALMDERPRLVDQLERQLWKLDASDEGIRYHLGVMKHDQPWNELCKPAEKLAALEGLLTKRQDLVRRIAALDPTGDAGHAELVAKALDRAGRDKLAKALTPTRSSPAAAEIPAVERDVAELDKQVKDIDPASRLHGQLLARRQAAQDRLQSLRQQADDERAELAAMIVQGPHGGRFEDIAELAATLRRAGLAAEADSIDRIRYDLGTVPAIVAELVRP
jgi:hypothetical protein